VLVASPKADTVEEAGYFAEQLHRNGLAVRGLVVNRTQPVFGVSLGGGTEEGERAPAGGTALAAGAVTERARTLAGTALGDHYRCLADSLQLARGEAEHLAGLAERVAPAPVVKVPVQPFEVTDLASLATLARLIFEPT
jgi:hypothetical protein